MYLYENATKGIHSKYHFINRILTVMFSPLKATKEYNSMHLASLPTAHPLIISRRLTPRRR